MKEIPLTRGFVAIVDDEDFQQLIQYSWHTHLNGKTVYAATCDKITGKYIYMHRLIMNFPACRVDHRNRNGLDCRRENLRLANGEQNNANQGKHRSITSSAFKGVYFDKSRNKWRAAIDSRHIGRFSTQEEAARAYDAEALLRWGDYACTNF